MFLHIMTKENSLLIFCIFFSEIFADFDKFQILALFFEIAGFGFRTRISEAGFRNGSRKQIESGSSGSGSATLGRTTLKF
jgi:hypothetical protein